MDHPKPWLRHVKASDLHDNTIAFDAFEVKNVAGDHLGDVNGFIVDSTTGDPYYLVVDSRGWFKTKHFLVPIAHARLDAATGGIVVDLTRDQVHGFPGFDLDEFDGWSDEQFDRFSRDTAAACTVEAAVATVEPGAHWTSLPHHRRPDWWDSKFYDPKRAGEAGMPPETWGREVTQPAEPAMAEDRDRRNP
jgi:hypothetical protein